MKNIGVSMALARVAVSVSMLAAIGPALAADVFPSQPVRIVIGFPPGGGIDTVARLIAPKLSAAWKQPVIVENKPGANGVLATQQVAAAPADGHTILFGTTGNLSINPVFRKSLPFDMARDFAPVTQTSSVAFLVMSNPALPVKNLAELIAYAKANPGRFSFGSSGTGGLPHLAAELLNRNAGMGGVHVPYKGSAPAMTDLIGGQVQFMVDAAALGLPNVKSGRVRALATTAASRLSFLPDVPAVAETLPGFEAVNWYGMVVRAGTPPAAIDAIQTEVARAMQDPEIRAKLVAQGTDPVGSTPAAFGAFMKSESARWAKVIEESGIERQ
ncbi:MAG: Bug family tripartite tricarboxylate transporter substrate binding protein [Lautropia sp.]